MSARCAAALLLASLGMLLVGATPAAPSRAEAAVYWGNSGFLGAANFDGSAFVDGVPYGAANVPEIGNVCGVAVAGGNLYWADAGRGSIGRTELGTNPTGYVDLFDESVAIDESLVSGLVSPCGIAADGAHIYWASPGSMTIGRANLDGSAPERNFISGVSSPCGVAVDGGHLYWGSLIGGSVGRAGLDGKGVEEGFVEGVEGPCGVAVDGAHVYWSNWLGNSIGRAGIDGSAPDDEFIGGLQNPCGVAVDGGHVFWTNWNGRDPVGQANLDGSGVNRSLVTTEFYLASCGVALDSRVFKARPPRPSARAELNKMRHGRAKGVTFVTVRLPNPPQGLVISPAFLGSKLVGCHPAALPVGYMECEIRLWLGSGPKARSMRRRLKRKGRLDLLLRVTLTEPGLSPGSNVRPISFVWPR